MVNRAHSPQSEIEAQAESFRNCFKPIAYRLDKNFSWMTDSQREALGQKADEALKQAYIEHFAEMYGIEDRE